MKSRSLFTVVGVVVAALAIVFSACKPPLSSFPKETTGSLHITVSNAINSRTLVPPIDMSPASYTVTGTGPESASFTRTTTGGMVSVDKLAFGDWSLVVTAANASGQLIGSGTAGAQVHTGETTTVTVAVCPIAGTGSLNLAVNWPESQVESPSITASLTPAMGAPQPLNFDLAGASASYENTALPTGYYTFSFSLFDNGIAVAGAVEVVRIIDDQTTEGSYSFANVNMPGGAMQVNIDAQLADPLPVSIEGAQATQLEGGVQELTASVADYPGNVACIWYVNGVVAQNGGTEFTFGSGVTAGYYRIDVTVFSDDGARAGSAMQNLQVMDPAATLGYLYVLNTVGNSFSPYQIRNDGVLSPFPEAFPAGFAPSQVAVTPDRTRLYITSGDHVLGFAIGSGGVLTQLPGSYYSGLVAFGIVIAPDGNFLYVSNFNSSTVSVFGIEADGALTSIGAYPADSGPEEMAITPDGHYLYVLGLHSCSVFGIAQDGTITRIGPVATGALFGDVEISPDGSHLYLTDSDASTISAYRIDPGGTLSPIAGPVATGLYPFTIAITPDGSYLYVADSNADTVSAFSVHIDGTLTRIPGTFTTEHQPFAMAITPDGRYLYVTDYFSHTLSTFGIGAHGVLAPLGTYSTGSYPIDVVIVTP